MNKESLPTVETLRPLEAIPALTASTAGLAHAGIVPSSIPPNKFSICEDTKASVGSAAIAALTSTGLVSTWAVIFAGSSTIEAAISWGMLPTWAIKLAAAPWAAVPFTALCLAAV